jgi:hypothetical protein
VGLETRDTAQRGKAATKRELKQLQELALTLQKNRRDMQ